MADQIGFGLILSKNQRLPFLKGQKHELVLNVKGDTDPLSIQRLYDAVQPNFLKQRDALNQLITNTAVQLQRSPKQRKQTLAKFASGADKRIQAIEQTLKQDIKEFVQEAQREKEEVEYRQRVSVWKFGVRTTWSTMKIVKDLGEMFVSGPAGAKKLVDLALDIKGLIEDILSRIDDEKKARQKLQAQLKKVKALKRDKDLTQSQVKDLEGTVGDYADKLDGIEIQARNASRLVPSLLKEAKSLEGVDAEGLKLAEKAVDQTLSDLVNLSNGLKKGRTFHKQALIQMALAKKAAKKDGWFSLATVGPLNDLYKLVDDLFEDFKLAVFDKVVEHFSEK